jgi:polyisoprenoid-binding protein YceI
MKPIIFLFLFAIIGKPAGAQYKPVDDSSSVHFRIKNFGFGVTGSFTGLTGTIHFDPQHPADAAFDVSVNAVTINTDNDMRDDHLRAPAYFDVKNHPLIRIVSDKVTMSGKKEIFVFTGKLTIKDHTKDISFPFSTVAVDGGWRFKGVFTINRKDFGVGGTSTISDNLEVELNVMAK